MTAKETKEHRDELQAMRDGTYDSLIYEKYIKPSKMGFAESLANGLSLQADLNDDRLLKKIGNTNMILIKNNSILVDTLKQKRERR